MTLLLRVLGVFALLVCVEKPAHAQNQAWCLYKSYGDGYADCRYATFQQCLADRVGTGSCSPSPYPFRAGTTHPIAAAFLRRGASAGRSIIHGNQTGLCRRRRDLAAGGATARGGITLDPAQWCFARRPSFRFGKISVNEQIGAKFSQFRK